MQKRTAVVIIAVIQHNGKYLFTQRAEEDPEDMGYKDAWQFPGGGLEFGENPIDCLHREVREETGLDIQNPRLLPQIFGEVRREFWHGILLCYLCDPVDPSRPIVLNDESSGYNWYTSEEIKHLRRLPFAHRISVMADQALL